VAYRARIGLHAMRANREQKGAVMELSSPGHTLCVQQGVVFVLIMTIAVAGMAGAYYAVLTLSHGVTQSSFARGLSEAMIGQGMHVPLNSTLCMPGYGRYFASLLLLSGDVEMNPGPGISEELFYAGLKTLREDIRKDTREEVAECVRREMAALTEQLQILRASLAKMENGFEELSEKLTKQNEELDELKMTCESYDNRLEYVEQKVEEIERRDRRNNVILYGVPEVERESFEDSERLFIKTVNKAVPDQLQDADVVRAHRLGKRFPNKNRPIIARLARTSDKFAVLRAREALKADGVGVAGDLTALQRTMIRDAKEEGLIGYFSGGRFFTKERPPNSAISSSVNAASSNNASSSGSASSSSNNAASSSSPATTRGASRRHKRKN